MLNRIIWLAMAMMVCSVIIIGAETSRYIPLNCITKMMIINWGQCSQNGNVMHCPAADLQFTFGCSSPKKETNIQKLDIYYPAYATTSQK